MKRSYFIAGTGTDIGKTFTTCALLYEAKNRNRKAAAYKPVISGWCDEGGTDTHAIIEAGGGVVAVEQISPWRLKAPLSPHMAAPREQKTLDLQEIIAWSRRALAQGPALQFIEGVGGVAVPLTNRHTTLDWMAALDIPVILVTGSYLGSISHTLTALEALERRNMRVHALVVNESQCSTVTWQEAQEGLAPYVERIGLQIYQPCVSSYREAFHTRQLLEKLEE